MASPPVSNSAPRQWQLRYDRRSLRRPVPRDQDVLWLRRGAAGPFVSGPVVPVKAILPPHPGAKAAVRPSTASARAMHGIAVIALTGFPRSIAQEKSPLRTDPCESETRR